MCGPPRAQPGDRRRNYSGTSGQPFKNRQPAIKQLGAESHRTALDAALLHGPNGAIATDALVAAEIDYG
jgi:hypothetical protein